MEYIYIPTGGKVTAADGAKLPAALYAPVKQERKKAAPKRTAKKGA